MAVKFVDLHGCNLLNKFSKKIIGVVHEKSLKYKKKKNHPILINIIKVACQTVMARYRKALSQKFQQWNNYNNNNKKIHLKVMELGTHN